MRTIVATTLFAIAVVAASASRPAFAEDAVAASASRPAFAEDATIEEVRVECDLPECGDSAFVARLVAVSGLRTGEALDEAALARAVGDLGATGYFREVVVETAEGAAGVTVVIRGVGATIIRNVRVRAGVALGSEIRRRIFLRSGQDWSGDPQIATRQVREIIEYYEGRGFFGTHVDIDAERIDDFVVDLTFRVRRGERRTVDRIYVRGNSAMDYDEVASLILGQFSFVRTFTADRFARAQRALIRRYRELGYIQARIAFDDFRVDDSAGSVDLFVEVREGDWWDIRFSGNRLFSDRELLEALTFYKTGFVDDAEILHAVGELQSLYETVGHFFADITFQRPAASEGAQALYFTIDEGHASEIREIAFEGVTSLPEEVLRESMGTSEYDILATGGYLQRSLLSNDIAAIERVYRAHGHLEAVVPRVTLVGDDAGRSLYVTVHVVEGPQTTISGVRVEGLDESTAERVEDAILARRREADPGHQGARAYDAASLADDRAVALAVLFERGYSFATIDTRCEAPGDAGPIDVSCLPSVRSPDRARSLDRAGETACTRIRRGALIVEECRLLVPSAEESAAPPLGGAVSVVHDVTRGRRIEFGEALIRGNFDTRQRVVRRELPFRIGAPFDYQLLLRGQSRLRALALFDSVRVTTVGATPDPSTGEVSHVVVQLEESSSRFLEHRVGLEARLAQADGLLLVLANEPTFRDINVFGRAKEIRLLGNFDFDVLNPDRLSLREFRAGAGIVYLDRRFYLSRRMEDPWESQAQLRYRYDLLAVPPAPLERELAFDARVREEFDAVEGLSLELGLGVRRTETLDQSDPALENDEFDPALILSLSPRVTFDRRRDNPLNPTRGYFVEADIEMADDFFGVLNSERFTKFTTRMSGFIPVGRRFVVGVNGRFGTAFGGILSGFRTESGLSLPVSERFSLGGVTTLRGFAEGEVSSTDTTAFGGDVVVGGNLELRYPFIAELDLAGALFVDTGQLAQRLGDLRLGEFRSTAGFGIRWIIADLLPVVFDYGAVLGRRPGEAFGRLHFNVGYTF